MVGPSPDVPQLLSPSARSLQVDSGAALPPRNAPRVPTNTADTLDSRQLMPTGFDRFAQRVSRTGFGTTSRAPKGDVLCPGSVSSSGGAPRRPPRLPLRPQPSP